MNKRLGLTLKEGFQSKEEKKTKEESGGMVKEVRKVKKIKWTRW
jgi:hypothetical protein